MLVFDSQETIARRKKLYEVNKELLEIDPNLIIHIKLKCWDNMLLTSLGFYFAYHSSFKNYPRDRKLIGFTLLGLITNFKIYEYYSTFYPEKLLSNTRKVLAENKNK